MPHNFSLPILRYLCLILCGFFFFVATPYAAPAPASDMPAIAATPDKQRFKPAVVYEYSKDGADSTFIEAARTGMEKAMREYQVPITEFRVTGKDTTAVMLKRAADSGANPIIALGYQNVMPVLNIAERYPNTHFTVIDGLVPPLYANVQSILFKDHEGAFLVGYIAGKTAKSGRIGFIGGMDIPVIRNFAGGFAQGVHYANPKAEIESAMIGTTAEAWSDPDKAHSLAINQFNNGVEIIFTAAGGSGVGALKAANETNKLAIGVDTNQNGLFPHHILTSMVKRVDVAVYDTLKTSHDGKWNPGIKYLGISEGALDYAIDQNNRDLLSPSMIEDVAATKERIINGIIKVENYAPK